MPFSIERNDMALMQVDAIVVTANEGLQINGGLGLAVAQAAGLEQMQAACDKLGGCPTGSAVVTPAFDLDARHVVHVVGPVWQGGDLGEPELLRQAYDSALACAWDAGDRSIALPLISAHTFGAPVRLSFSLALDAVRDFLEQHEAEVHIVLYGEDALAVGVSRFGEVAAYIDDHYVETHSYAPNHPQSVSFASERPLQGPALPLGQARPPRGAASAKRASEESRAARAEAPARRAAKEGRGLFSRIADASEKRSERKRRRESARREQDEPAYGSESFQLDVAEVECCAPMAAPARDEGLASWLDQLDAPFSTTLLALIDARGMTDAQVYKRANMSRQLFSKIRSDPTYRPTKKTVLALSVALGLDLAETADLLRRAGFALSRSSKADVIVEYFIVNGTHDIFAINEALYAFDQPLL